MKVQGCEFLMFLDFLANMLVSEHSSDATSERVTLSGLRIMREILRIQAIMQMYFKRIIYFIPERGPLERFHKVL